MDLGESYLEVALRFGRLAPGLVESSGAATELAAEIDQEEPLTELAFIQQAAALRSAVGQYEPDPDRKAWLTAQLLGLEAAAAWLAGEPLGYRELMERCHGVPVIEADESQFEGAHELLLNALPGPGKPTQRFDRWAATQQVCGERLSAGFEALAVEFRTRTRDFWDLPDGETVEFEMVRGYSWAANADYRGALRTVVQINDELPIMAWRMVELVAHEAYPGHHAEQVCKQAAGLGAGERRELSVWAYPTPQALMAEGIAMLAPEMLLGEEIDEVGAACLTPLGIDYDVEGSAAIRQAQLLLLAVRSNLALMLDEDRIDRDGMRAYARRWLLQDDAFVERVVSNLRRREWPPYESCYVEGLCLCRRFVGGDRQRFGQLLCRQLTPAALRA